MSFMDEFKSGSAPGLSADRLNEPFHLQSMAYDSVNNKIDLTFGRGRAIFLDTVVEKNLDSAYSILAPAINTTYYVYLNSDGTYTHNTTGTAPSNSIRLWAVSTGATVDALSKSDLRAQVAMPNPTPALIGAETPAGAQAKVDEGIKITDPTTGAKYLWKVDNGQMYLEEVG
jgi:hypothetical protein